MSWEGFYLICFVVGLVLSVVSIFGGFAHLHLGHIHLGHAHIGHAHAGAHGTQGSNWLSGINGFTVTAFLCWFGGAGYLLTKYTGVLMSLVLLGAALSGLFGATILWAALFKVLLPRERLLTAEETEMPGVVGHISDQIRDGSAIGEIIFSQTGSRRCSAAKSEDGQAIERGAEVVVVRYERGIAYVKRWDDMN
jgi:membrane protein implicated in regulation of membrane protease activity